MVRKILIIRFSSIGDIVLTTPVMRCLKHLNPKPEIHFLTKKSFAQVVSANPNIDRCIFIEREVEEVIPQLKNENYDLIIDLHHNIRSLRIKNALKKPSRSFNKINIRKWMMVNLKINRLPDVHIVDRYLKTVEHLGVVNDQKGLDFFIPASKEISMQQLPLALQKGYIALVIGAQHATKRLPYLKLEELCSKINLPIAIIGGPEDVLTGEQLEQIDPGKIVNLCGKFDLFGSASIVKQARAVITHDTGMMHIAAAFQQKIISIWGNTIPEFGMYPYMPGKKENFRIIENKSLGCRPCSKIGFQQCPKTHFKCMNDLKTDVIIEQLNELLH